jgi:hypothetical protein
MKIRKLRQKKFYNIGLVLPCRVPPKVLDIGRKLATVLPCPGHWHISMAGMGLGRHIGISWGEVVGRRRILELRR